jgi:uncharacterized delta-60 repeat protein
MRAGLGARRGTWALLLAAALVVVAGVPSLAAPGQLDPSFGAGGVAVTEFPSSYSGARAVAVQADGRIVAAGFAHTNDTIVSDFAVVRYAAGGALDPTFGLGGRVRTDFDGRFDEALAVAVQPDGKVVVAGGSSDAGGTDMAVARYTSDGALDPTFAGDGMALLGFDGESSARAVAVQRDGKVLLTGRAVRPLQGGCCDSDFALARLTTSGGLDGSFGGDGRVTTDFLPGPDRGQDDAHAVLVRPDGRILAAGGGVAGAGGVDFAIAAYRADGSLDPTFSRDGRVTTDFAGYPDEVRDLAVDARGRIVAGGQSCRFPGNFDEVCDFGLARYSSGGTPDPLFGRNGKVRTDLGAVVGEGIRGVAVQHDGRIVVAGDTQGSGGFDVGVVRYRADGRLDHGFGVDGIAITPVSPGSDEVGGMALQPPGRLLVAGTTAVSQSFGLFVARYRLA